MDNEIEVMRIVRIPPRGQLVVQVGENRFNQISEISNEALGRRVLAAVGELVVFANGYDALVTAGVAPPLSTGGGGQGAPYAETLEERQAAFLAALEEQRDAELAAVPVEAAPKPVVEEAEAEVLSIVDQINPLLQKQVNLNPELRGRDIHLEEQADGGLSICVEGQLYARPEQIEDIRIRKAIAAALKEWDAT